MNSKRPSKRNDHDPADTNGLEMDKEWAGAILAQDIVRLERL